jgi:lysophospholipase L1-like esterase
MIIKLALVVISLIVLGAACSLLRVYYQIRVSQKIVVQTVSFDNLSQDKSSTLLVLGDSTAYGVGASRKEESIPALFAGLVHATYVENLGVSGARVADLPAQRKKARLEQYDFILVQIGGNDVVARHNPQITAKELEGVLSNLPKYKKLVVQMCGDVGVAPLLPWYVRPYYTKKTLAFHVTFEEAVTKAGGTYINLYLPKEEDPFYQEPKIYFAEDGFHPSGRGYAVWFQTLQEQWSK